MDESVLKCMENFDGLWQRVSAERGPTPPPPPLRPEARLLMFRREESCHAAAAELIARRSRGAAQRILRSMASEDRAAAVRLARLYEESAGRPAPPPGNCRPAGDTELLAEQKRELARQYEAAARKGVPGAALFRQLARQKERQSQSLRRLSNIR